MKFKLDELVNGFLAGILCCLLFSAFIWVRVGINSLNTMDRYRNIQEQAIQKGYATWGQSIDGDKVFVWKDAE